ncbi:MAG: hypothetical protein N3E45_00450 [Oscillatoriaceae bacterium SKW80]|nr:hypothetical protein [Oscillatoriaceae bacterium SKYG93]MCX8119298.1 hypothetical protein [Oscillatoriaceae bacterium SKW80]MDW8454765.1 hypothetical protein [Oscillatoriaceae cyanobacterium SKYGB_i_bin93]HIK28454.1 hypothetical protein [Oscillatoriaceae cyanobacterium M7585_C2015_266]
MASVIPKEMKAKATKKRSQLSAEQKNTDKQERWLEIVEWTSLAGSVIGTIVVGLSGQILNATVGAGLALTISLSLVNRHKLNQQQRQETEAAIAEVHHVLETLYYQLQKLAAEPIEIEPMHQALFQLGAATQRLESSAAFSSEDLQAVSAEVELLRSTIYELQGELQVLAKRSADILPLQDEIKKINRRLDTLPPPFAPRELYRKVAELEQKNQKIFKPYLQRLAQHVKQLDQKNALLSRRLQLLVENFNNRPELKQMQGLQGIVAELVRNVDRLQELPNISRKIDNLSAQLDNELQPAQILKLTEELAHLPLVSELENLQGASMKIGQNQVFQKP